VIVDARIARWSDVRVVRDPGLMLLLCESSNDDSEARMFRLPDAPVPAQTA